MASRDPFEEELDAASRSEHPRFSTRIIAFLVFFSLWIVLSGRLDALHLGMGAVSCLLVTLFSGDLGMPETAARPLLVTGLRFLGYLPWLLWQIFLANLHMLRIVFHPRMTELIDPRLIRFESGLKGEPALVTFANSITLTPGTITVYVSVDGKFTVHAIDKQSAESLPEPMQARIAAVFRGF